MQPGNCSKNYEKLLLKNMQYPTHKRRKSRNTDAITQCSALLLFLILSVAGLTKRSSLVPRMFVSATIKTQPSKKHGISMYPTTVTAHGVFYLHPLPCQEQTNKSSREISQYPIPHPTKREGTRESSQRLHFSIIPRPPES